MKLCSSQGHEMSPPVARLAGGFTLTELMVSMTIFSLVIAGMIAGHIFGLKVFQLTRSNLGAADSGQMLNTLLGRDVRAAQTVKIGRGDQRSFQELSTQEIQQGNAIQLYASGDTNDFIRYYVSEADKKLVAISSDGSRNRIVSEGLLGQDVFLAEDAAGRTLTNRQNSFVLAVNLQYSKVPGSDAPVGKGQYYDTFRWQMKFALRARQ